MKFVVSEKKHRRGCAYSKKKETVESRNLRINQNLQLKKLVNDDISSKRVFV